MIAQPLSSYASRFLLPAVLLVLAIAAWLVSSQLGTSDQAVATASPVDPAVAPLASIRRLPEFATSAQQDAAVAAALAALPTEPGGLSCAAIWVDGVPVLEIRSGQSLVPSYAQLLLTGHAAIDLLGSNYRFNTRLMSEEQPDANGRIFSDVYLVGGGDPVLMTYLYSRGFRPALTARTSVEQLAQAAVETGLVQIDGGIIAVEDRYDTLYSLSGWPESYRTSGVVGPLSALQLDDGLIERPAANLGIAIPAAEPATLAAERFGALLESNGVDIRGGYRTFVVDDELPTLVPLARVQSPVLSDIVFQMMAVNDATAAEMLLKELGVAESGEGTTQAGSQAVQRTLVQQGVDVPVPFRDASGLDPIGGVSCSQLVAGADSIDDEHPTLAVLPSYDLPGVFDGALVDIELASDLRLVGGAQGDASGFVGRTVDQGRQVTIASIVNRAGGLTESDLAFQRALVELVDDMRSSTTVEALAIAE